MTFNKVLIIGGGGAVGTLFAKLLSPNTDELILLDLYFTFRGELPGSLQVKSDFRDLLEVDIQSNQLIIIALPEEETLACLEKIQYWLRVDQCLVDTTSVKTQIAAQYDSSILCERLSINPLFAPQMKFAKQSLACVTLRTGPLGQSLLKLIRQTGCQVVDQSAECHDHCTAAIQVATHAALLTFGMTLAKMNFKGHESRDVWTPPHCLMLALLSRMAGASPEVYRDIQFSHPQAEQTRHYLRENLLDLERACQDSSEFEQIFRNIRDVLGDSEEDLRRYCKIAFATQPAEELRHE